MLFNNTETIAMGAINLIIQTNIPNPNSNQANKNQA